MKHEAAMGRLCSSVLARCETAQRPEESEELVICAQMWLVVMCWLQRWIKQKEIYTGEDSRI